MTAQVHRMLGMGEEYWMVCLVNDDGSAPFNATTGRYDLDFTQEPVRTKEEAIRSAVAVLKRRGFQSDITLDPRDGPREVYDHKGDRK